MFDARRLAALLAGVFLFSGCVVAVCDKSNNDCGADDAGVGGGSSGAGGGSSSSGGGSSASGGGSSASGGGTSASGGGTSASGGGSGATGGGTSASGGGTAGTGGGAAVLPDTCATAQAITMPAMGGQMSFTADTSMAHDDEDGTCNAQAKGPELVYKLSMLAGTKVTAVATRPAGSLANPVLYLRASPCSGGTELACSDSPVSPAAAETVTTAATAAQDVYLFVEGRGTNVGPTLVTVSVQPPNDDCTSPTPITFTGGLATLQGDTRVARNDNQASDTSPSCSPTAIEDGKDLFYTYTLTTAQDVDITATPSDPTFHPAVYVRRPGACSSGLASDELGCDTSGLSADGTPSHLVLQNQQPGTYFLIVDSTESTSGIFTLDLALSAPTPTPTNDTCASPTALTFTGNIATITGDTTQARNDNHSTDASPTCSPSGSSTGRDLVYSYTLTTEQDVQLTATPAASNPGFEPVVYVRKPGACTSVLATDELGCVSTGSTDPGTAANLKLVRQMPGTYFVWVDSAVDTKGAFTLDVVLSAPTPPATNETCMSPTVLTVGGAPVQGDTSGATDDFSKTKSAPLSSACDIFDWDGNDLIYQFTAPTTGTVHAVVSPSANFDVALLALAATCSGAACTDYADIGGAGQSETLDLSTTAGTTYFLVVDSYDRTASSPAGSFSIVLLP
jgi:hypothetical protein